MAAPTGILFYDGRAKPLSTAGQFQAGCYLQFYLSGTTTLANVYADGLLTTPLSQTPGTGGTTAASDGRFVAIYLNPATTYRYQLYTALGVLLEDVDPVVVPTNGNSIAANFANPATGFGIDLVANGVKSYDVVTSVRAANIPALAAGQTLIIILEGGAAVGDGNGGAFYWSASSTAADDGGATTIKPTASAATGRFLRLTAISANQGVSAQNTVVISQNTTNVKLADLLGNPGGVISATVTINQGVRVIATDPQSPALDLSGLASGSTITLTNNGYILGRGGNGGGGGEAGIGGSTSVQNRAGLPGRKGGDALKCGPAGVTVNINNATGFIWAGGGGGGGGGSNIPGSSPSQSNGGGGGGGAGGSLGGYPGLCDVGDGSLTGTNGGDGTWLTSAANGTGSAGSGTAAGQAGGAGGDWGVNGTAGGNGSQSVGGALGVAGNAVSKNSATVNFNSGGTAPNVKGAIV